MNIEEAKQACKNGATAAFISGTLTTLVVAFAMLNDSAGDLAVWNDPTNVVDITLIFACAIGMLKFSRTASITVFIYFIVSKAAITLETGQTTGLAMTFIFLFFFAKAIQGSFAYKKHMKAEDPQFRSAPRWVYWMSVPTLCLFFVAAGYGVLSMTDAVPSTEVVEGAEVSESDRNLMIENGIIYDDEQIEYLLAMRTYSVSELETAILDDKVTSDWYYLLLDAYIEQENNKENPLPLTERQINIRNDFFIII